LFFFLWFFVVPLYGQKIEIRAEQEPLNQVLLGLAKQYRVQLSFDDTQLSEYNITLQQSFENPEAAIHFLISDLPLEVRKIGEVYTIYKRVQPEVIRNYPLSGRVIDLNTGESLPYSHVQVNQSLIVTDFNGIFTYLSTDSVFHMRISYLGYYIKDTTLLPGITHIVRLTPSIIGLKEVVIEGSTVERSGQIGEEAGTIRLNHKIAYRLPGNGDNAVFNFLRLQPGILAAGERSSELIIWGSYSGHSKIMFDGFTIFGLKNFNDNLSFVNPYMAKDIKVLKGGYSAEYDDRVGGIVDISGINGNTYRPSINLNINNMTVNGMASVPLLKQSSLTFAYRHTYYNLYDENDLSVIRSGRRHPSQADISIYPDYVFRDFNLKYAGSTSGGDPYYVSLYEGKDKFSYQIDQERINANISQEVDEGNLQRGGSAFFGRTWNNGVQSHFSLSASGLSKSFYEKQIVTRNMGTGNFSPFSSREGLFKNQVLELTAKNMTRIPLSGKQVLEAGWSYTYEQVDFSEDSLDRTLVSSADRSHRIGVYLTDEIRPVAALSIRPGLRADYPVHLDHVYLQPRIQLSLDLSGHWRLNAAAGIYNQFIAETSVIDELGNIRYVWAVSNNQDVPVLKAQHLVGGITFRYDGLSIGVESYYKTTTGITRQLRRDEVQELYQGDARMYGVDVQVKQYFWKHEAWASYTWSRTEEHFPYMPDDVDYMYAPQDQRHEVKGAVLLNFRPFYFSTNYVYGSGFRSPSAIMPESDAVDERYPYNRLDVALIYRHSIRSYHFEIGFSILNVLNHENIKYSNLVYIPDSPNSSISVHAEAVPFTPTIYLNMAF